MTCVTRVGDSKTLNKSHGAQRVRYERCTVRVTKEIPSRRTRIKKLKLCLGNFYCVRRDTLLFDTSHYNSKLQNTSLGFIYSCVISLIFKPSLGNGKSTVPLVIGSGALSPHKCLTCTVTGTAFTPCLRSS